MGEWSSLVRRGHGRTKPSFETNGNKQEQVQREATKQKDRLPTRCKHLALRNHASGLFYGQYNLRVRYGRATRWNVIVMVVGSCLLLCYFYAYSKPFKLYENSLASTHNSSTRSYPRSMACYFDEKSGRIRRYKRLETYAEYYRSFRTIIPQHDLSAQKGIEKSEDYDSTPNEDIPDKDCIPQYSWQTTSFPSCNLLHEIDLSNKADVRHLSDGHWRDVWTIYHHPSNTTHILKTLRYKHDFTVHNYERHRRDAVASEHLTPLRNVVDIYAFCGQSALYEYSSEGDLHAFWKSGRGSLQDKLSAFRSAYQVAEAVANFHSFDNGLPSIAHTDITPWQFILIDGVFKLNDFNRCRFLWRKSHNSTLCAYRVQKNPGKLRSPEEYRYLDQDEKVDVYSMGHIFYMLLTSLFPFVDINEEAAQKVVIRGEKPFLHYSVKHSTHPVDVALFHAMQMCYEYEPTERASATDVFEYLKSKRLEIENYYKTFI